MAQPNTSRPYPFLGAIAYMALGAMLTLGVQTLLQSSARSGPQQAQAMTPPNLAAFHEAVQRKDLEAMRRLLSTGPQGSLDINAPIPTDQSQRLGFTPLISAVYDGDLATVKMLIESKAKTEIRTADGRTALVCAAGWGDADKVRALLDAGARTDARANDGWTALMLAAARGEPGSVKALVESGADVNATNKWRQTALMAASRVGSIDKVRMLLDAGASADITDVEGNTALSIAATSEVDAQVLAMLIKAGAPLDTADRDGVTALMKAAERGDVDQTKVLLGAGANRELRDTSNKWTAKDWAAKRDDDRGREVVALLSAPK